MSWNTLPDISTFDVGVAADAPPTNSKPAPHPLMWRPEIFIEEKVVAPMLMQTDGWPLRPRACCNSGNGRDALP